ncbi:hypothetical protein BJ508DRAFT_313668 [Ascobolus immersus RN42]|uniref:Uncharacterized protein n=1 Tax=Ascobolus immersus RN42 TaxID=1160509 RepID=A0A3N4HHY1_ASCIM|nr:hypothetical protein BJ508DRAFT_313668 [Ascobolus immersus RN42]
MKFTALLPLLTAISTPAVALPIGIDGFFGDDSLSDVMKVAVDFLIISWAIVDWFAPLSPGVKEVTITNEAEKSTPQSQPQIPTFPASGGALMGLEAYHYLWEHGALTEDSAKRSEPFRLTEVFSSKEEAECARMGDKCSQKTRPIGIEVTANVKECGPVSSGQVETLRVERLWDGKQYIDCPIKSEIDLPSSKTNETVEGA